MHFISLKEFVRTGCLGPVEIGLSKAEVRRFLGPEDGESWMDTPIEDPNLYRLNGARLFRY